MWRSKGQVVGGSSAVNTTIALRGFPKTTTAGQKRLGQLGLVSRASLFNRLERDLDFGDARTTAMLANHYYRYKPHQLLPHHQAFMAMQKRWVTPIAPTPTILMNGEPAPSP